MRHKLSADFYLDELVPTGVPLDTLPVDIETNIETLVVDVLQPLRNALVLPVAIHDGYRPPAHNASVGGKPTSDHLTGSAADFNIAASEQQSWEQNTIAAFHWIRTQLDGQFGQLILEDHRASTGKPSSLWVHVSIPTPRHPGTEADAARVLVSSDPTHYTPYAMGAAPTS